MGYRTTERARTAKVRREWYCDVCEAQWTTVQMFDDDSEPECPTCAAEPAAQVFRPFAMKTNASRAVEFVQKMAEEDYGVTNIRDHLKPGDTANVAPPPIQGAEADAITREILNAGGVPDQVGDQLKSQVQNFWGANGQPGAFGPTNVDQARAMAVQASAETRSMGADPIGLLHEAGKQGLDPTSKKNLKIHGAN